MPLTLTQLRTPLTRAQATQRILDELANLGFAATSWQSGGDARTLVEIGGFVWSDVSQYADTLSRAVFNSSSTGDLLTAFSDSHYDNQRVTAISAIHTCTLTDAASTGPHTIAIGAMTVRDNTTNATTYKNTTGGTIPVGGALTGVSFQAETTGIVGNVAVAAIDAVVTGPAGVTVTNPDLGSGTSITTQGIDLEADSVLQTRNTTKWALLSQTRPSDAYVNMALVADTDVARVSVDNTNPRGAGTVDIYIARATAIATAADVATVQAYVDARRPVTADVLVIASAALSVAITGTVHVTEALRDAAKEAEIEAAATAYVDTLKPGGEVLPGGVQGFVIFSELIAAISAVDGVRRVSLTAPTADVALLATQIAQVSTVNFTYVDIE